MLNIIRLVLFSINCGMEVISIVIFGIMLNRINIIFEEIYI